MAIKLFAGMELSTTTVKGHKLRTGDTVQLGRFLYRVVTTGATASGEPVWSLKNDRAASGSAVRLSDSKDAISDKFTKVTATF